VGVRRSEIIVLYYSHALVDKIQDWYLVRDGEPSKPGDVGSVFLSS
jgi:hypothetical protein